MQPHPAKPGHVGRVVRYVEIMTTLFRMDAWACMYELVDTEHPHGWGLDLWFYDYCVASKRVPEANLGIVDDMVATHNPLKLPSTNHPGWVSCGSACSVCFYCGASVRVVGWWWL